MSSTAIFRADATPEIGSGHVMRSLVLAAEWVKRGGDAVMFGDVPPGLHDRFSDSGVDLVLLKQVSLNDDADETINLAMSKDAGWVVLDGYMFDKDYVATLRSAGLKVLQFSDGQLNQQFGADLVLDQNLDAEDRNYDLTSPGAQALLGIQYACIGLNFRNLLGKPGKKRIAEQATKALITFGGSDPANVTAIVVEALRGIALFDSVVVVIGVSNQHADQIIEQCSSDPRFRCVRNVSNMAELMSEVDIAIAAAGSTSWELAALGVPSILVTTADNQEPIARAMAERGVAESAGWIGPDDVASVSLLVEALARDSDRRNGMSKAGRGMVDGKGANRVVDSMLSHSQTCQG